LGSFLNAVVYRLHTGESIVLERSHCPHCHHELAPKDLVPVLSFMLLRGRCRYCSEKISWQYPLVELLTGVVLVLLAVSLQFQFAAPHFWLALVFAATLIVIGMFDFNYYLILDIIVFPALVLATIWN